LKKKCGALVLLMLGSASAITQSWSLRALYGLLWHFDNDGKRSMIEFDARNHGHGRIVDLVVYADFLVAQTGYADTTRRVAFIGDLALDRMIGQVSILVAFRRRHIFPITLIRASYARYIPDCARGIGMRRSAKAYTKRRDQAKEYR
jgi:hypothetical protein